LGLYTLANGVGVHIVFVIMLESIPETIRILIAMIAFVSGGESLDRKETLCLSKAVYFEARNQNITTQISIASFMHQFADRNGVSICEEIYKSRGVRYPWAKHDTINFKNENGETLVKDVEAWENAALIASLTIRGYLYKDVGDATHFLMPYTIKNLPSWYDKEKIVSTVGVVEYLRLAEYK